MPPRTIFTVAREHRVRYEYNVTRNPFGSALIRVLISTRSAGEKYAKLILFLRENLRESRA